MQKDLETCNTQSMSAQMKQVWITEKSVEVISYWPKTSLRDCEECPVINTLISDSLCNRELCAASQTAKNRLIPSSVLAVEHHQTATPSDTVSNNKKTLLHDSCKFIRNECHQLQEYPTELLSNCRYSCFVLIKNLHLSII